MEGAMGWTIGEVARRTGVPTSTLRFWEQAGLLPTPRRVSGRRDYQPDVLDAVALVQLGQRAGLTIADIHSLVHDTDAATSPAERWRTVAAPRASELDEQIARLTEERHAIDALLGCACTAFHQCTSLTLSAHP
jgi:MerR family transcriptional regulator, redox-sensitive transcriptional activator SoxR